MGGVATELMALPPSCPGYHAVGKSWLAGHSGQFQKMRGVGELIRIYGNPSRYDHQKLHLDKAGILEEVLELIRIIHKHKKGLDQEIFQILENRYHP